MRLEFIAKFSDFERLEIEAIKDTTQKKLRFLIADLPTQSYSSFKDSILTGDCFASLFHNEEPTDWSLYLRDIETAVTFYDLVTRNTKMGLGWGLEYQKSSSAKSNAGVENSIKFKNGLKIITNDDKTSRLTFDFIHRMPYFDMATQQLFISRAQYDSIKRKELVTNPSAPIRPASGITEKFISCGWNFKA